jgi:hypothetical protein
MGLGAGSSEELGVVQRKYEKFECLKRNAKGRSMGMLTSFSPDKVMHNEADINFNAHGAYSVYIIKELLFLCKYCLTSDFNETFLKICIRVLGTKQEHINEKQILLLRRNNEMYPPIRIQRPEVVLSRSR